MSEPTLEPEGIAQGLLDRRLVKIFNELFDKISSLNSNTTELLNIGKDIRQRIARLETAVMNQTQALDDVLNRVSDALTGVGQNQQKLGQDVRDFIQFVQNNPGVDLTQQVGRLENVASTLDATGQALIDTDAEVLKQQNPIPVPAPEPAPGQRR